MKQRLLQALYTMLSPLCRVLQKHGISYSEVAAILKFAFVRAAVEGHGQPNRKPNLAKLSAVTGMSRRELSRLLADFDSDSFYFSQRPASPSLLLAEWQKNQEYLRKDGRPLDIPYDKSDVSFQNLAKLVGGDATPAALRDRLLEAGCIRETARGELALISDVFAPNKAIANLTHGLENCLLQHCRTIAFNCDPSPPMDRRFDRVIYSNKVSESTREGLRHVLVNRLEETQAEVSRTIDSHDLLLSRFSAEPCEITAGVGLFYFEY